MAKRIAVLASGSGTNLQALIDAQKNGEILGGEIVLVLSNKENAYALTRAKQNGIGTAVIPSVGDREMFTEKIVDYLVQQEIDLVVLAGFMIILGQQFTKTFRGRILNVHPALIPSFCGDGFYGLKVHEKGLGIRRETHRRNGAFCERSDRRRRNCAAKSGCSAGGRYARDLAAARDGGSRVENSATGG